MAYYASKLARRLEYAPVKMTLVSIMMKPPPSLDHNKAHIQVQVHQTLTLHFDWEVFTIDLADKMLVFNLYQPLPLNGDVKITFCKKINVDMLYWLTGLLASSPY